MTSFPDPLPIFTTFMAVQFYDFDLIQTMKYGMVLDGSGTTDDGYDESGMYY